MKKKKGWTIGVSAYFSFVFKFDLGNISKKRRFYLLLHSIFMLTITGLQCIITPPFIIYIFLLLLVVFSCKYNC